MYFVLISRATNTLHLHVFTTLYGTIAFAKQPYIVVEHCSLLLSLIALKHAIQNPLYRPLACATATYIYINYQPISISHSTSADPFGVIKACGMIVFFLLSFYLLRGSQKSLREGGGSQATQGATLYFHPFLSHCVHLCFHLLLHLLTFDYFAERQLL